MGKPPQPGATLSIHPGDQAIVLDNDTCVYCGHELMLVARTKEHLIGRRFVPRGTLHQHWNLIAGACWSCNNKKSHLEDDIAAVSMHPDAWGKYVNDDKALIEHSRRKAKRSTSTRTGKTIERSSEKLSLNATYGEILKISAEFSAPPQVDPQRVADLAKLHIAGCFYWLTYRSNERKGGFIPGEFFVLPLAIRADWGNPLQIGFMKKVAGWEPRFVLRSPQGYFQIAIRRSPDIDVPVWSWALEWNQNFRTVGFFGDEKRSLELAHSLPDLIPESIFVDKENEFFGIRMEVALDPNEDLLFTLGDAGEGV